MVKRTSLKGLGAKLFEPQEGNLPARHHDGIPAQQRAGRYPKATFYLSQSLLARLDGAWMEERRRNLKIKKSDLVSAALEAFLSEREGRQEV